MSEESTLSKKPNDLDEQLSNGADDDGQDNSGLIKFMMVFGVIMIISSIAMIGYLGYRIMNEEESSDQAYIGQDQDNDYSPNDNSDESYEEYNPPEESQEEDVEDEIPQEIEDDYVAFPDEKVYEKGNSLRIYYPVDWIASSSGLDDGGKKLSHPNEEDVRVGDSINGSPMTKSIANASVTIRYGLNADPTGDGTFDCSTGQVILSETSTTRYRLVPFSDSIASYVGPDEQSFLVCESYDGGKTYMLPGSENGVLSINQRETGLEQDTLETILKYVERDF